MQCGAVSVDQGTLSGQCDGNVGDSCSISCDTNYLLHFDGTLVSGKTFLARQCLSAGAWDDVMPQCQPSCGDTIALAHATATCTGDTTPGGDPCIAISDSGY
jgi:hypothetical protein